MESLPKEYGGTCSCKGSSAKCIPEFDLSDLRISDMSDVNGDVDKVTVGAGKKHEIKLTAGSKGASVHWFFRVQGDYNITFRIEVAEEKKEKQIVRTVAKALADQGSYTIKVPANITVVFDNEFSYFRAKSLQFTVFILQNDEKPVEVGEVSAPVSEVGGEDEKPEKEKEQEAPKPAS